jgi:hypothetical protein
MGKIDRSSTPIINPHIVFWRLSNLAHVDVQRNWVVGQFQFPQGRFSIPSVASWVRGKAGVSHRFQA